MLERYKTQMTVWRMRIAFWIPKDTDTLIICNIIAFPLQQWFHERASVLLYRYIVCLLYWTDAVFSERHKVIFHVQVSLQRVNVICATFVPS